MFISVIIPTFNRAHCIRRALISVAIQTHQDWECIVIDDGSSDHTQEVFWKFLNDLNQLNSIESTYLKRKIKINSNVSGRFSIHQIPHAGVSTARNTGASLAQSDWLAFLDSDDEWLPNKLANQVKWLLEKETSPIHSYKILQSREIWIRNGRRVNPPKYCEKIEGDLFFTSLERCMITPSSVLLQKSLYWEMGGFSTIHTACEDYDLWLKITTRHLVGLIDSYDLVRYGGEADQLSFTTPKLDRYRLITLRCLLESELLTPTQREATTHVYETKRSIYRSGLEKRQKLQELEEFEKNFPILKG